MYGSGTAEELVSWFRKWNGILESYPDMIIGTMETCTMTLLFITCMLLLLLVQDDDYRIFFVNSYSAIARRIICEVGWLNLYAIKDDWDVNGWYLWWY